MKFKRTIYFFFTKIIFHPKFIIDFFRFRSLQSNKSEKLKWQNILPFFNENTSKTNFDTHYIYHPAWAARIVKKINPETHTDISSTLHFCTQLSAFIKTEFYDYRPAFINLNNLNSASVDLCAMHFLNDSIKSLSCMHTIEHIGLGRYGDPLDPDGDKKAADELQRVLAKEGNLLVVTPVGKPQVAFNGHRIYSYEQIIKMFSHLNLIEFTLIPDNALEIGIIENADPGLVNQQNYGCGCFWFRKKTA